MLRGSLRRRQVPKGTLRRRQTLRDTRRRRRMPKGIRRRHPPTRTRTPHPEHPRGRGRTAGRRLWGPTM